MLTFPKNKQIIKVAGLNGAAVFFELSVCLAFVFILASSTEACAQGIQQELSNHLKRAERYHDLGNNKQAKTELEEALKLDPKSLEILNSLGAIHLNLSESSSDKESRTTNLILARKYFSAALDMNNEFAAAWNGMAGVYYLSGETAKAISCYKKALALAPKRAYEVYTNLANTLRDCGQLQEAEGNYKQALALHPLYAPAHNGYAELLYDSQRYAEAFAEAQEAVKEKLDYATAYYHLGLVQSATGHNAEALKAYMLSLRYEKNPRYATDTHALIKRLGLNINEVSEKDLEQFQISLCRAAPPAVKENQTRAETVKASSAVFGTHSQQSPLDKLHLHSASQDPERAIKELSVLLKKHPEDPVVLNELGISLLNKKKYSDAESVFKRAWLHSHEQSSAVCYNLGLAYLCKGSVADAQNYLEKAKRLAKNDDNSLPLIENALGIVLKQKGNLPAAQSAYEDAIANGGKHYPVFHYNLALLLEKMNKPAEAAKELNLYLQLDPNGIYVQNVHAHLVNIQH